MGAKSALMTRLRKSEKVQIVKTPASMRPTRASMDELNRMLRISFAENEAMRNGSLYDAALKTVW